jgi:hypothetical protein
MSVDHLKTNSRMMTRLLVRFSVSQREGLAVLSRRLNLSQQALIRSSVAKMLEDNRLESNAAPASKRLARSEVETARPQPSPDHVWVSLKDGRGYWRAKRTKRMG